MSDKEKKEAKKPAAAKPEMPKGVTAQPKAKAQSPKAPATPVPHISSFKLKIEVPGDATSPGEAVERAWAQLDQMLGTQLPDGCLYSLLKPGQGRRV